MKKIEIKLQEELVQLTNIIKAAEERLTNAPTGSLRVRNWNGKTEFYYKNDNTDNEKESRCNGRYLKKREECLVKELIQRDYDVLVVKQAKLRIKAIEKFLEAYGKTSLQQLYRNITPGRKQILQEAILSDEEYARRWQEAEYEGKKFVDDEVEIITERGERVRSKSEKIIADKLYALGIPYRYEYPLVLSGNIRVYPDFTILKLPEREEVYLEHFGRMDDEEYVESVMYKLSTYEKNRIYLGVNLFVTHETSKNPLNTRALDGMLKSLFCEE